MKLFAKWRVGLVHSVLWSVLSVAALVGCDAAVSESESPEPSAAPLPADSPTAETPAPSQPELDQELLNQQLLAQGQILPVAAEVEIADQTLGLEVAETPQQQAIGLMARESLPDDRGMLFPFEPARPVSFWMKNVLIPLDMVFIHQGEVVAIASDVPPCEGDPCPTYGPGRQPVDYVLELRGGRAAELGMQAGDAIEFTWLEDEDSEAIPEDSSAS
ncbi:DUF192 domain-containing protein [Leptolyngbya iicbica]|uniref:DUF192 domain-containing protein n=1 Tax=Leptolyngbya iicbica TaxID=3161580 RepID=UPI00068CEAA1|nr:DUF192 domain-containing protein [Leptolyngbya sp. LK]